MAAEKNLDNKVLSYLKSIGSWNLKYWGGSKYGKSGIPDILACVKGHFIGIEDKGPEGRPKLLQLKNLEWIRKAGGYGILLYPDQFKNFKRFIEELGTDDYLTEWQFYWYSENIDLQKEWKKRLE